MKQKMNVTLHEDVDIMQLLKPGMRVINQTVTIDPLNVALLASGFHNGIFKMSLVVDRKN